MQNLDDPHAKPFRKTYTPLEHFGATIDNIVKNGLTDPSVKFFIDEYTKESKIHDPTNILQVIAFIFNKYLNTGSDEGYFDRSIILMRIMRDLKENFDETANKHAREIKLQKECTCRKTYVDWDTLNDTFEDDISNLAIIACEKKVKSCALRIANPAKFKVDDINDVIFQMYDEFSEIADITGQIWIDNLIKRIKKYFADNLNLLKTEKKRKIVKPFIGTYLYLAHGKKPSIQFKDFESEDDCKREIELTEIDINTIELIPHEKTWKIEGGKKEENSYLVALNKLIVSLIECYCKNVKEKDIINNILNKLNTFGYNIKFVLWVYNRLLRTKIKHDGNTLIVRMIKSWTIKRIMSQIQVNVELHDISSINLVESAIQKYKQMWNENIPFMDIWSQISKINTILQKQHKLSYEYGQNLGTAIFGLKSESDKSKQKKAYSAALMKYIEYTTISQYSWNGKEYPDQWESGDISKIDPEIADKSFRTYIRFFNDGKIIIDYFKSVLEFRHALNINKKIALILQNLYGKTFIETDPDLDSFDV
jgi:hypothetical protein